ncbi:MAG: NnrU family protein [Sneathiella sp.]|nr:NnrU family protein [Sneathiella sp.]
MTGTITHLVIATSLFLGIHIIPSSFLRQTIVGKIGTGAYMGVYSLISAGSLIWMVMAFNAAPYGAEFWQVGSWGRYVAIAGMVLASILFIGPYTGKSPTGIGGQGSVKSENARSGLNAITRHPLMWAIAIWSSVHLLNNGDLKSVIFFAGLGGLALAGTFLIDAKRAHQLGDDWNDYSAHTSNIPFLALLTGRAKLSLKALWWRVLIGLVIFMAFFHLHTLVIGVSPFPL